MPAPHDFTVRFEAAAAASAAAVPALRVALESDACLPLDGAPSRRLLPHILRGRGCFELCQGRRLQEDASPEEGLACGGCTAGKSPSLEAIPGLRRLPAAGGWLGGHSPPQPPWEVSLGQERRPCQDPPG